jgi:hypothetical protein
MSKLEEGKDKSKGGCPNPDDRGVKSYPMKHQAVGLENKNLRHLHATKPKKGK